MISPASTASASASKFAVFSSATQRFAQTAQKASAIPS
jgi:hypothetical protein